MLRFRNRFTGTQAKIHHCKCGAVVSISGDPGRQTVIHAYPFCAEFAAALKDLEQSDPTAVMQRAAIVPATGETIIVADGDTPEDVS